MDGPAPRFCRFTWMMVSPHRRLASKRQSGMHALTLPDSCSRTASYHRQWDGRPLLYKEVYQDSTSGLGFSALAGVQCERRCKVWHYTCYLCLLPRSCSDKLRFDCYTHTCITNAETYLTCLPSMISLGVTD